MRLDKFLVATGKATRSEAGRAARGGMIAVNGVVEKHADRQIDPDADIIDNSLVMLLKALLELGVEKVSLAGFDGYSLRAANYYKTGMEYDFVKAKAKYLNEYVAAFLETIKDRMTVEFLTKSHYED